MSTKTFKKRNPIIPISELEQMAFCQTSSNLRTKTLEEEFKSGVRWQKAPNRYLKLSSEELEEGIKEARNILGDELFILGHHYQRQDVIKHSDVQGDSYKLSVLASQAKAKHIIFCGVHFMAETAEVLSAEDQNVILPNMAAGCSMADMADIEDVQDAWNDLDAIFSNKDQIIPITYMNSTAEIKSLCGENGGLVCTSSTAKKAFQWAFDRAQKVLFLPDQHLGRNTAKSLGIPLEEMVVWDPFKRMGGLSIDEIEKSKVILWKGHCSVHTRFTVEQIENARNEFDANIIVHPECTTEVVDRSDYVGSTEFIVDTINNAPKGTAWAVGTEINLVNRLSINNKDKKIFCLDPVVCPCATMYRIHPAYLLWVLDGLRAGLIINHIKVSETVKRNANKAIKRMLAL